MECPRQTQQRDGRAVVREQTRGAGRPADIGTQRLRYYAQQANNSQARGAEHWPGERELDPSVLGREFVPDRAPNFAGPRVLQPRDGGKALERHRGRYKREQRRSDMARCDEEPCAKRLAASRARIAGETPNCEPRPRSERVLM